MARHYMRELPTRIPNLARWPRQGRLFNPLASELTRDLGIGAAEVAAWMQAGLLSYDPRSRERLSEVEEAELTFVTAIARSGLSYEALRRALAQLERPYAYWPSDVLWDFGQGKWRYVPGEIGSAVADAVEEALAAQSEEQTEGHISRLVEEGDLDSLRALLDRVQEAISQVADGVGGADDGSAL